MIESVRIFGKKTNTKRSGYKNSETKSFRSVVGDRKDRFFLGKTSESADFGGFLGIFEFLILWAVKKTHRTI